MIRPLVCTALTRNMLPKSHHIKNMKNSLDSMVKKKEIARFCRNQHVYTQYSIRERAMMFKREKLVTIGVLVALAIATIAEYPWV
ncbi:hypothetical protein N007_02710 [Alicyclobacillus acidoterrestris ATCC 49025]|nr:hypothetical protein N007_02710 [Alicyclobacillus acidoterrestris ATCC 49025]